MKDNLHNDLILENKTLRHEFTARGLEPDVVCQLDQSDPELENRQLKNLLCWVNAYQRLKTRARMEQEGFEFPPVDPGYDPDSDWLVFERWIAGKPTTLKVGDPNEFFFNPDTLSDAEIEKQLHYISDLLGPHSIQIDFLDKDIPVRLVYQQLKETLSIEDLPVLASGCFHLDGCTGFCPGCFQRPWCESGQENKWTEDEEAGKMVLPECLNDYVCATPFSLQLMSDFE